MTSHAPPAATHPGWYIVSQVKTHRVIYFTDDVDYQLSMEGDWYFVSHYLGELPAGMTLKNCWSWRFDGQVMRSAKDPVPEDEPLRLLESNRKALRALLRELVDAMRKPWAPSSDLGETLRAAKLEEARAFMHAATQGGPAPTLPLLQALATARAMTMSEAADLVLERHRSTLEGLLASEALRERFKHAIDTALTNDDLSQLRKQLLAQMDAGQAAALPPPPDPMTPADLEAVLDEPARAIEAGRLRAQLRQAVNALRGRIDDGYDQNDGLLKHKAKMAQSVLNNGGRAPEGLDISLLAHLAEQRRLGLEDAARLILGAVTEAENILRRTERDKDRFLARIDAARTLQDFQTVSLELRAFTQHHASA